MIGKYATNVGLIGNAANPRIYYVPYCIGIKSSHPEKCGLFQDKLVRIPLMVN